MGPSLLQLARFWARKKLDFVPDHVSVLYGQNVLLYIFVHQWSKVPISTHRSSHLGTSMDVETDDNDAPTSMVITLMDACSRGDLNEVQQIILDQQQKQKQPADNTHGATVRVDGSTNYYVAQQDETTGASPLMAAAAHGHGLVVEYLLQQGAPWNALDRQGRCAGDYGVERERVMDVGRTAFVHLDG